MDLHIRTNGAIKRYSYIPYNNDEIHFEIKTASNAQIALTNDSEFQKPLYEIILGAESNKESYVRKRGSNLLTVPTRDLFSIEEHSKYWLDWREGTINFGEEGIDSPLFSATDNETDQIKYVGFASGPEEIGNWIIKQKMCGCVKYAPLEGHTCDNTNENWTLTRKGNVPPNSFPGGEERGLTHYVCRANFFIPGTLPKGGKFALVSWKDTRYRLAQYEVLCDQKSSWEEVINGKIPYGALVAGKTENGEPLYVGRVMHMENWVVGSVLPSVGLSTVNEKNEYACYQNYDVLMDK